MVYRFPVAGQEIKMGAKLIVREGQAACFVNKGELADVFEPGTYTLSTENMPFLTKIMSWKHGFNSPFKAEVYFVTTRQFTNQAWGTQNPILLRDPEFGYVRLRAFGTYAIKVADPATLLKNVVGTAGQFSVEELSQQLRRMVVSSFSDALGEMKIAAVDLASHYEELGDKLREKMNKKFEEYGVVVASFVVENISLPKNVEEVLDKRTSMGIVGNIGQYAAFNAAEAMGKMGDNGGGGVAGLGAQMAAGMGMGQMMAGAMGMMNNAMGQPMMGGQMMPQGQMMGGPMMGGMMMQQPMQQQAAPAPAAPAPAAADPMAEIKAKLSKLKELQEMGLISEEEFNAKRSALLASI
jgi:membrane protease subunit (stomatin/prohibitin family)